MSTYEFDVKLFSVAVIEAETENEARAKLNQLDWLIDADFTIDGEADLMQVDGEPV